MNEEDQANSGGGESDAASASTHHKQISSARKEKKDEFYTQLTDIEKEMAHYHSHLQGSVIFCNCDDPLESHFFRYFALNFDHLQLKKLITTHYDDAEPTYKLEIDRAIDVNDDSKFDESDTVRTPMKENGDFRSPESIELLNQADIVITNPPFSLFRDYVAQLIEHKKKFLILGNIQAVSYKTVFPLVVENKIWLGPSISSGDREFRVPDDYPLNAAGTRIDDQGHKYIRIKGVRWFTNLDFTKRHERLDLYKHYTPEEYPKYDEYDAINVDKVVEIPMDYDGVMGVPLTFIDKYNPEQFEIVGMIAPGKGNSNYVGEPLIDGKYKYRRIAIRRLES